MSKARPLGWDDIVGLVGFSAFGHNPDGSLLYFRPSQTIYLDYLSRE